MARRRGAPATPPTGPGTAPGTIHQVSEKSEPQPSTPERPPVKEATFRMPRVAVVAAFLAMVSATPFAWSSWWLATVYLLPIGFAVWVLRTQTTVDATGLTARTVFGSRFIGWGELTGLSVVSDAKVFAVLADKEQVRLPGVRARHLPIIAVLSGGRIPAFPPMPEKPREDQDDAGTKQEDAPADGVGKDASADTAKAPTGTGDTAKAPTGTSETAAEQSTEDDSADDSAASSG